MGLKLAKTLRDNGFKGLIIALVSLPESFPVETLIEIGFNACIQKPLLGQENIKYFKLEPDSYLFDGDELVFENKDTPKRGKLNL